MTRRRDDYDERGFAPQSTDGLPMFTPPSVPVASSERGAELASKSARTQHGRIILALRAAGCVPGSGKYLSRDEIAERCELTVNAACGRLGPSGLMLDIDIERVEDACTSSAGLAVYGYRLSARGVRQADALSNLEAA